MSMRALAITLLLPCIPGLVHAADGVLEIHQTCAVQTGCFSGDTPGLPVTIDGSAGRSYRLTSDLTAPAASGIILSAEGVEIDLGGFEIAGPVACTGTGAAVSCLPTGTTRGISGVSQPRLRVHGGAIRGFGLGIVGGERAQIRHVVVESIGGVGINLGARATVSDSTVFQVGGVGTGIDVEEGSVVQRNVVSSAANVGISAGNGSSVVGNAAYGNGGTGIDASWGCVVQGNSAHQNGSTGIEASSGSTLTGNASYQNGHYGLALGSNAGYRGNTVYDNATSTVFGGVDAGGNVCDGSTTCP